MLPPQPQFSLPTPKYFRRQGCSWPLRLRSSLMGERPPKVMYSTHSLISCTVPLPRLPFM